MILVVGEILFDEFPDYRRLGGAPFNFAFHLLKLGEKVKFISRIGDDRDGKDILERLTGLGFPTADIQTDARHPTGLVRVLLKKDGIPEFDILPDVAYDHISYEQILDSSFDDKIDLVYFGSVIQRTAKGFQNLHSLLNRLDHVDCLYDVNLRPKCVNKEAIAASMNKANILKLNSEELEFLQNDIFRFQGDFQAFKDHLFEKTELRIMVVTKGDQGSDLYLKRQSFQLNPEQSINLVDTVGAGDSYAAMLALGYTRNWPPEKMLEAATHLASRICEVKGGIPLNRGFYSEILALYGND